MTLPLLLCKLIATGCAGLFAGGLIMVMWAIVPSWQIMRPEEWLRNQQCIGPYIDRYMPLLDGIAVISTLLLLFFCWPRSGPVAWSIAALLSLVAVALISQLVNVPINRQVHSWSIDLLPAHSLQLRRKWIIWHAVRTSAGIVAFIALLLVIAIS